jgi:hypothetical protein
MTMHLVFRASVALSFFLGTAGRLWAGDNQKEQHQILDKAIKAMGGQAKVGKLNAAGWKGTTTFDAGGQQLTLNFDGSALGWDKQRIDLDIQVNGRNENLLAVINGDKGWVSVGGKVNDLKGKELAPVRDFFYGMRLVQMLPILKGKDFKLAHLGELKIGERSAVGLSVTSKGRPAVSLFLDKESGRPLKTAFRITADNQEKELELLYDNYKDFDGLQHFTKMIVKLDGMEIVTELSEIRAPGELEASLFDRP